MLLHMGYICTCGRCNASKASDHALDGAKHRGLAEVEGVEYGPGEDAGDPGTS